MAITPLDIKAVRDEGLLRMVWSDGETTQYAFKPLRCACSCAACVHEFTGERLLDPESVPENITIDNMSLVGTYALKITWSDGHDTGLFTWTRLRELATLAP